MRKLFHITHIEAAPAVLERGLNCGDDGFIYLFEGKVYEINGVINGVSHSIAKNQLYLDEFCLIEVDSRGIFVEPEPDNVGEITARWQWRIKQANIEAGYLKKVGEYKTTFKQFWI